MIRYTLLFALALMVFWGCNDGYIDDIHSVDPGADEAAPVVTMSYPVEGTAIRVVEDVTSITISFSVSDDIELGSVVVMLDGEQIAGYDEFIDYRSITVSNLVYDELTNGAHTLVVEATDLADKTGSKSVNFEKIEPYQPMDGEVFYMPFDGDYLDLVTLTAGTKIGSPVFATEDVVSGIGAYQGVEGAYITFSTADLTSSEFSASFWMKINAVPDRAGILVVGPEDTANPDAQNVRTSGFRFFREAAGTDQRFKLNVGTGSGESWFDGGDNADLAPESFDAWHHFAFTITDSQASVYIDGSVVSSGSFDGVNWTGCDLMSIMSGAPRFTGWGHNSDLSLMDELRIFDKALTQEEVQAIMAAENPN